MNSKVDNQHPSTILSVRIKEGSFILLVALAIFLFISLWSFSPDDPGCTTARDVTSIENASGKAGAWFSSRFLHLFGYLAFLFPFMVIYSGYLVFRERKNTLPNSFVFWSFRLFGLIFTLLLGAAISAQHWLGTNIIGQDIFARAIYSTRTAFEVGLIVALGATLLPSRQAARLDPVESLRYE